MFIRELQVDGYGALQGVKCSFEAPVTVVYGPNEAGKSTLLRFVRSMLYGFPTRKDPVERGEPVFGGRHGGRIVLRPASGMEWVVERYAERGSGLTVRDGGGLERLMLQAEWERLALGGVSERLFRQLFAVSLDELHELRTLQGEEISNYLYHAGMAGGAALTAARRQIGAQMDKLFRPKGTTQEINRLLSAVKDTETAIRQGRDSIGYFNEIKEALAELEGQLEEVERRLPLLRLQAAELQGAYDLREWWLQGQALLMEEAELRKVLPDPSAPLLPEDADTVWGGLKQNRSEAADNVEKARKATLELKLSREALVWDENLVTMLPELERLESLREGIVARSEEGTELEAERRMLNESIKGILTRLSAEWSEEDLQAFGGLAAEREQVRRLQQDWEEAERAAEALQADVRRIARQQEALQADAESSHSEGRWHDSEGSTDSGHFAGMRSFGPFVPRTKAALLQAWHGLEDEVRLYERARSDALLNLRSSGGDRPEQAAARTSSRKSAQAGKKRPAALMYGAAVIAGLAGVALPFLLSRDNSVPHAYLAVSALLVLMAAGIAYLASRQRKEPAMIDSSNSETALRIHRQQVAHRLGELLSSSEAAASLLPESSGASLKRMEIEDAVWRKLRDAVYAELDRLEARELVRSKRTELEGRLQELTREKSVIERDLIELNQLLADLHAQWQSWLKARKLPVHLTPESLPELLGLAEQGQTTLRQRRRIAERLSAIRNSIEQFEDAAAKVFAVCPPPVSHGNDAVMAVQGLFREALRQKTSKDEAVRLDSLIIAANAEAEHAMDELSRAETAILAFLEQARATNEVELEQRLRIDRQCRQIQKQLREIQLRLESGRDPGAVQALYEWLERHDEASLAALLSERQLMLAGAEQQRSELLDRRGRYTQELERLRTESELEDRSLRLRELQSKLEALMERYTILALSDTLIARTKAVFEEERQPEVLRIASRYLSQITDGAYIRIVAPGDRPALLAETKERGMLDSAFLSRGTQEQLYLAMRFALCDAASREHPLPLLLDDLFVHFDEQRLNHTIPVLQQLAQTRQVILFTCHRHVARAVAAGIPTARTLTLGQPGEGSLSAGASDLG